MTKEQQYRQVVLGGGGGGHVCCGFCLRAFLDLVDGGLLYLYVSIMKLWHLNHTPRKTAIITLQTQIQHPAKLLTNITNITDFDPNENQLRYMYGVLKVALVY